MIALLLSFLLLVATATPTACTSTFASEFVPVMGAEAINDNCIWSPVSIGNVLSMLYFGADHETADELKSVLKSTGTKKELAVQIGKNHHEERSGGAIFHLSDRLYFDKSLHLKKQYVTLASNTSKAKIRVLKFHGNEKREEEINTWLESETANKIHDMITKTNTDWKAGAVVINEIYFKAKWFKSFPKKSTYKVDDKKTHQKYEMMVQDDIMLYAALKDLNAYAAVLKLQGTNVSMLVLLPRHTVNGLKILEEKLKKVDLTQLPKAMKDTHVTLKMPKFKVEFDTALKPTLKKLGLRSLFARPDFSDLLDDDNSELDISEIRHKSFIEVTEEGIEAASSTGVEVHPGSAHHNASPNRQFFFALMDEVNVYFAGHIARM